MGRNKEDRNDEDHIYRTVLRERKKEPNTYKTTRMRTEIFIVELKNSEKDYNKNWKRERALKIRKKKQVEWTKKKRYIIINLRKFVYFLYRNKHAVLCVFIFSPPFVSSANGFWSEYGQKKCHNNNNSSE